MRILVFLFVRNYVVGAIWLYRIKGLFRIRLNSFWRAFLILGIDKLGNKYVFDDTEKEKHSLLAVLWQIACILYFVVAPLLIKYGKVFLPIGTADFFIQSLIWFGRYGYYILGIVMFLDLFPEIVQIFIQAINDRKT